MATNFVRQAQKQLYLNEDMTGWTTSINTELSNKSRLCVSIDAEAGGIPIFKKKNHLKGNIEFDRWPNCKSFQVLSRVLSE